MTWERKEDEYDMAPVSRDSHVTSETGKQTTQNTRVLALTLRLNKISVTSSQTIPFSIIFSYETLKFNF